MLSLYTEEPGMVCSDWLRENEGLTPSQLKQLHGLSQMRGVEIEALNGVEIEALNGALGLVSIDPLNGGLGLVPDWQFYPQPPPHGTGKYSNVTVDLPGDCASYGICGAMGLDGFDSPSQDWTIGIAALAIHSLLRVPAAILDGIHGYKRNDGDGLSAATWGILGFLFPLSVTTVAVVQGYGKVK